MNEDIAMRQRRIRYRANHRGTKEMDWMLGRFADAQSGDMDNRGLEDFEVLLARPDPEIQGWLLQPETCGEDRFHGLVGHIRTFNGLDVP